MINHIPKSIDFEKAGIDSLCQSVYLIHEIRRKADESLGNRYNVQKSQIWKYNQSTLRICLISLFQGTEILMKSEICSNSPFLLIEDKRSDWPTLPEKNDKEFDAFYTISGENLLTTFFALQKRITKKDQKNKLISIFEEIRTKRNKAMHGLLKDEISAEYILEKVLKIFTIFFSKDKWLEELVKNFKNNPLFDINDRETTIALFNENLDYLEEFLGKSKLNRHLSQDIKRRRYYCPQCFESLSIIADKPKRKWAFIIDGELIKIKCLVCNKSHSVLRTNCSVNDCMGDVLFKNYKKKRNLCLTCGELNE